MIYAYLAWSNNVISRPEGLFAKEAIATSILKNPSVEELMPKEDAEQIIINLIMPTNEPTNTPQPTATLLPTEIPTATSTPMPTQAPYIYNPGIDPYMETIELGEKYDAKISYYYPDYGGINCDIIDDLPECEETASGRRWRNYGAGRWLACPIEFEFGTLFLVNGFVWECQDRGGAIIMYNDGVIWLDLLYPYMPYDLFWSEIITVQIVEYFVEDN